MMGAKVRNFAPVSDLSLEELVPKDNFYRHLEATRDLSFVRELPCLPRPRTGMGRGGSGCAD